MIPEYPKFKPLGVEDKDSISRHLKLTARNTCELSIGNIFLWKGSDNTQLTCINHNICLLLSQPNEPPYFLEPLGYHKPAETTDIMLKHIGRISRASESFVSRLPEKYKLESLRSHFDYVYSAKDLAELKGRKFDGKRNHIKRFKIKFPDCELVELTPAFKKESFLLFEKWFRARKESRYFSKLTFDAQKNAVANAFIDFELLDLLGGAFLVNGKLKGFTIGSRLNPETVSVHFIYSDPELPGIFQTILWEACNKTYSGFKYVNLEQDLGIPGLRTAKLSYHPLKLEEKFEVKFREVS